MDDNLYRLTQDVKNPFYRVIEEWERNGKTIHKLYDIPDFEQGTLITINEGEVEDVVGEASPFEDSALWAVHIDIIPYNFHLYLLKYVAPDGRWEITHRMHPHTRLLGEELILHSIPARPRLSIINARTSNSDR